MFRYKVGQEVEVSSLKKIGDITQAEMTQVYAGGRIVTKERYYVKFRKFVGGDWFTVEKLIAKIEDMEYINEGDLDVINKLLMDAFIDNGNFVAAKEHGIESGLIRDVN